MKAKTLGNEIIKLNYGFQDLIEENPYSNYDIRFTLQEWFDSTEEHTIKGYNLLDVITEETPEYSIRTEKISLSDTPVVEDNKVVYKWNIIPKTQEEIARADNAITIPAANGFIPEGFTG